MKHTVASVTTSMSPGHGAHAELPEACVTMVSGGKWDFRKGTNGKIHLIASGRPTTDPEYRPARAAAERAIREREATEREKTRAATRSALSQLPTGREAVSTFAAAVLARPERRAMLREALAQYVENERDALENDDEYTSKHLGEAEAAMEELDTELAAMAEPS
jgi:hypothetical protein